MLITHAFLHPRGQPAQRRLRGPAQLLGRTLHGPGDRAGRAALRVPRAPALRAAVPPARTRRLQRALPFAHAVKWR